MDIYYTNENSERIGPVSAKELVALADNGVINPETLVEVSGKNYKAASIKQLKVVFAKKTASPPTPVIVTTPVVEESSSTPSEQESSVTNQASRKKTSPRPIFITTGDIDSDYEIIGPVYYQISNKGFFGGVLPGKIKEYSAKIEAMKREGTMGQDRADWGFLFGEWSVGQSDFEKAFLIATEELKKRATLVGANAIIGMRQDIDIDTDGFAYFYLQMYGTAVKIKYED